MPVPLERPITSHAAFSACTTEGPQKVSWAPCLLCAGEKRAPLVEEAFSARDKWRVGLFHLGLSRVGLWWSVLLCLLLLFSKMANNTIVL